MSGAGRQVCCRAPRAGVWDYQGPRSSAGADQDLLGFMPSQSEVVAADLDLDGIAEWGEADQFDRGADDEAKFHESAAIFVWEAEFLDGGFAAGGEAGEGLGESGHDGFRGPVGGWGRVRRGWLWRVSR
jgi:hypothetical protein